MANSIAPIFFTACGVVVAGVVGYSVFESKSSTNIFEVNSLVQTAPKDAVSFKEETSKGAKVPSIDVSPPEAEVPSKDDELQKIVKLDASPKDDLEEPTADDKVDLKEPVQTIEVLPVLPSFGLVRVERDGSAVIAGEGPANEEVQLFDGKKQLAKTKVNSSGEFVFVLDEPLAPGQHELFLRVLPKQGEALSSSSFAFVDVPKPKTIGEVTILLAEVGKPTQILQKPETPVAKVEQKQENEVITAKAETSVSLAKPDESIIQEETKPAINEVQKTEPTISNPVEVSSLAPVLIEAADVENGKIFIAGTGEPRTSINIYLENDLLGSAQVAENGAFLFEGSTTLEAGRYNIRADMTKGGASVLARAEVTLVHEPTVLNTSDESPKKVIAAIDPQRDEPLKAEPEKASEESLSIVREKSIEAVEDKAEVKTEVEQTASVEVYESEEKEDLIVAEKKEIQTGSAVIIRRGDNLWTVARRNYGAGIRYTTIFEANRDQVRNPHRIYPGQVLKVPEDNKTVQ